MIIFYKRVGEGSGWEMKGKRQLDFCSLLTQLAQQAVSVILRMFGCIVLR
jgi:hypothetical protein